VIVDTIALAAMCLNHLVLPIAFSGRERPYENLYQRLLWWRRLLIALIIFAGYGFYLLLETNQGLVQLGLISFVAVVQFLPGVLGLLYWSRATHVGFIVGLLGGFSVWGVTLLLPLFERSGFLVPGFQLQTWLGAEAENAIVFGTFWSLAANCLLFVGLSLLTRLTPEEADAARACARQMSPPRGTVAAQSSRQFIDKLARIIGPQIAEREVHQALTDLGMSDQESRPSELHRLRERIERNLSGLIGPLLASSVVNDRLQIDGRASVALVDTMHFIEEHLANSRTRLKGLAAELDALRRYHRQILQELPLGVCALGRDGEVVIWNHAMEAIAALAVSKVSGTPLAQLPAPWGGLLCGFVGANEQHLYKLQVTINGRPRWFNLHKAAIEDTHPLKASGGMVILIEDLTVRQTLEAELAHTERLASIGRLAAGVAHEIGNPLTGIASLAQNLRDETDAAVVEESIQLIEQQIRRIGDIVQSLVTFAHGGAPSARSRAPIILSDCIEEAVRLVRLSRAGKQLIFLNRCDASINLIGDRQRLVQVFVNLLTNASDASRAGDTIEVCAVADYDRVRVEVVDTGCGIPAEIQDRVFDPFFTTKEPGEGTGLGLPMVYNIVYDHGGTVAIVSEAGVGTRVIVQLPFGTLPPAPLRLAADL
jgi:signal transduction histidine kinase/PAS domain-containing protein